MEKFYKHLLIFLLLLPSSGFGQSTDWISMAVGTGAISGKSVATDNQGNIYTCGLLNGNARFGKYQMSGKGSFFVKYTKDGSVLWAKALTGLAATAISTDIYDHVYLTGNFSDSAKIGSVVYKSLGKYDLLVAKYDAMGQLLWIRQGGGPGDDKAFAITNDLSGNTIIAGSFESYMNLDPFNSLLSLGKGDIFIIKYDSLGQIIFANKAGGDGEDAGMAVTTDLSQNVYLSGRFSGTATFHNNTAVSKGGFDIFLTKYNSLGLQLYLSTIGGTGDDQPAAMSLDGSANNYITGTINGTVNFIGTTLNAKNNDAFLAQISKTGTLVWVKTIGGDRNDAGTGISVDGHSNVYLTGVFDNKADLGDGNEITATGERDIFVAGYDGAGHFKWSKTIGSASGFADTSNAILVDQNGNLIFTGSIEGEANYGLNKIVGANTGSFFMIKTSSEPSDIHLLVDPTTYFTPFPNPSSGMVYFKNKPNEPKKNIYKVFDDFGRQIICKSEENKDNDCIDLSNQPGGLYLIQMTNNTGIFVKQILIKNK